MAPVSGHGPMGGQAHCRRDLFRSISIHEHLHRRSKAWQLLNYAARAHAVGDWDGKSNFVLFIQNARFVFCLAHGKADSKHLSVFLRALGVSLSLLVPR